MAESGATMSAVTTHFEHVVRSKLIANKLAGTKPDSIRGLARAMANGDERLADTHKRSLFKWMSARGSAPSPASRALVAVHLGVDAKELVEPDEEPDPVSFGDALQQMFDQAVERAVDRRLASLTKACAVNFWQRKQIQLALIRVYAGAKA